VKFKGFGESDFHLFQSTRTIPEFARREWRQLHLFRREYSMSRARSSM